MQQLVAFLGELGGWNWFIIALILLGLEILTPGINLLWFGLAAIVVGVLALITGVTWQWQLIAFALLSVATVFWVRRIAQPDDNDLGDPALNNRTERYIGRIVVVEEAIRNGRGRVRVGDTSWTAEGDDAPEGSKVRVVGANGTVLIVERERS